MTVYYHQIRALIDPEMSDPLRDGGRLQDVSLILLDHPARGGGAGRDHAAGLPGTRPRVRVVGAPAEVADRERRQP